MSQKSGFSVKKIGRVNTFCKANEGRCAHLVGAGRGAAYALRSHPLYPRPELGRPLVRIPLRGGPSPAQAGPATTAATYSALLPDCASTTAMAAMFTISRTEAPSCKMCTGLRMPISTGPMASAPPISCSTL